MSNVGYYILKAVIKPLSLLPLGFHRTAGAALGWLAGSVLRYRRDVVMTNLARSFPEMKYWDLKTECRDFYRHFGRLVGEIVWFGSSTPEKLIRTGIVKAENHELLNDIHSSGKSCFILASHAGNWELVGGFVNYPHPKTYIFQEEDVCVVFRKLSSSSWQRIMNDNRTAPLKDAKHYEGMVESFDVLRHAIRNRHRALNYIFIMDQFPYSESSKVPVTFMHQSTFSMDGAVALAARLGSPVVYMGMPLDKDGNYRMKFTLIAEDASAMSESDILDKYYSLLQSDLEAQPWNYLWTHKRWK